MVLIIMIKLRIFVWVQTTLLLDLKLDLAHINLFITHYKNENL